MNETSIERAARLHSSYDAKASVGLKVFRLNDYEWWMANSLEEAIAIAMKETGVSRAEACDDDARELTDEELQRLRFHYDDEQLDAPITFAERLQICISRGDKPGLFAATDY